jgi:hypothetical protein
MIGMMNADKNKPACVKTQLSELLKIRLDEPTSERSYYQRLRMGIRISSFQPGYHAKISSVT